MVGKDAPFKIYENAAVDPYLELIAGEERRGGAAAQAEEQAAQADEGSMDTDWKNKLWKYIFEIPF